MSQVDEKFVDDIPHGPTKVDIHEECGRHVRREKIPTGVFIYICPECNDRWSSKGPVPYVINTHRIDE